MGGPAHELTIRSYVHSKLTLRPWVVRRHRGAAIGRAADPAALVEPEALVAGAEGAIVVPAGRFVAYGGVLEP